MFDFLTVVILAGGQSRRMGQDKSLLLLEGTPLLQHVMNQAGPLSKQQLLISNTPEKHASFGWSTQRDIQPGSGSLGGLLTAAHYVQTPYFLAVACDMPWLNPDLMRALIAVRKEGDAVVPRWGKRMQPLHALYHTANCRAAFQTQVTSGEFAIRHALARLTIRWFEEEEIVAVGDDGRSFTNLNTPDEFEQAVS